MPDLYDQLIELLRKSADETDVKDVITSLPEEPQILKMQHGMDVVFPQLGVSIRAVENRMLERYMLPEFEENRKVVWSIAFRANFTEKLFNGARMGDLRSEIKEKFLCEPACTGPEDRYQIPPFVLLCMFDSNERLQTLAVLKNET